MYDGELLISERSKPKNMHWLPAGPWLVCMLFMIDDAVHRFDGITMHHEAAIGGQVPRHVRESFVRVLQWNLQVCWSTMTDCTWTGNCKINSCTRTNTNPSTMWCIIRRLLNEPSWTNRPGQRWGRRWQEAWCAQHQIEATPHGVVQCEWKTTDSEARSDLRIHVLQL